jgi:hypothetical protein
MNNGSIGATIANIMVSGVDIVDILLAVTALMLLVSGVLYGQGTMNFS